MSEQTVSAAFGALGTTAAVHVTDPGALDAARELLAEELAAIDAACSRFRDDSELVRVNRSHGARVEVSDLLLGAIAAAMRAAECSGGDVDPTVGRTLRALGYDRDFTLLGDTGALRVRVVAAPGWRRVSLDRTASTVTVPAGVELDLGATGKAFAADRAAAAIHERLDCGVLVNLGGDLALAGPPPPGGWSVRIADDHANPGADAETVSVQSGAIATSSVTARRWRARGQSLHHIVDPRTGVPVEIVWRTASVAAASCVDANTASTAAIVRGDRAPGWLESIGLPSRLVAADGRVVRVAGWPEARA